MEWRLYYEDGSTFDSDEGDPFDAPRTGVQVLVLFDEGGHPHLISQADYYYFEPERCALGWWFADFPGMIDHLHRAARPLVLFGRMMQDSQFTEIEKRALADFPRKASWRRMNVQRASPGTIDGEPVA